MRPVPELLLPRCVIARTAHWIAIDKPSGLPSRPAPGHASSALRQLEAWLGDDARPGVVHRLDRDTSGLLLFSLSPRGHRALVTAFGMHAIRKEYVAWVVGAPRPRRGTIDLSLARNSSGRVVVDSRGARAVTRYETLKRQGGFSKVRLEPTTGRMHQLRVHLAARGTPILGDAIYGVRIKGVRLRLHARRLVLPAAITELEGLDDLPPAPSIPRDHAGRIVLECATPEDFDRLPANGSTRENPTA